MPHSPEYQALAVQRQSRLSESCFEAIVGAADLVYDSPRGSHDYAGSDYTVRVPTAIRPSGGPVLSVQLKSVSEESGSYRRHSGALTYDLDAETHDRLVQTRRVPMVLVLVVFPRSDRWLTVEDDKVILMCTPYLINLEGQAPSGNSSTKAVRFGPDDRLDPEALRSFVAHQGLEIS